MLSDRKSRVKFFTFIFLLLTQFYFFITFCSILIFAITIHDFFYYLTSGFFFLLPNRLMIAALITIERKIETTVRFFSLLFFSQTSKINESVKCVWERNVKLISSNCRELKWGNHQILCKKLVGFFMFYFSIFIYKKLEKSWNKLSKKKKTEIETFIESKSESSKFDRDRL